MRTNVTIGHNKWANAIINSFMSLKRVALSTVFYLILLHLTYNRPTAVISVVPVRLIILNNIITIAAKPKTTTTYFRGSPRSKIPRSA